MSLSKSTVAIVLDAHFGDRLVELANRVPVWICNSEANTPVIHSLWEKSKMSEDKLNVTSFSCSDHNLEHSLLNLLGTIDEHHPFWSTLEVYGVGYTSEIMEAFQEYGTVSIENTLSGFVATRPKIEL